MKFKGLAVLALAFLIVGGLTYDASASACRNPASLLFFPNFQTDSKHLSVITITNTGPDEVYVRIVWVSREEAPLGYHCVPADTWVLLTPMDTFTFLDDALFFESAQGFSYVYAVDGPFSEAEIDYDYLIGQELVWSTDEGDAPQYVVHFAINAVAFQALDVNGDGLLELDGVEYTLAPAKLFFPRFFGQPDLGANGHPFRSWLIFVNLTGGKFFSVTTKFLIFNDNEKPYSKTKQFPCWYRSYLNEVSGVFENSFLVDTDHDEDEPVGFEDLIETGWFYMYGEQAYYDTLTIDNPSIYAVLVEAIGKEFGSADLPWSIEDPDYDNASLWLTTIP
jgi:hypothetical protein